MKILRARSNYREGEFFNLGTLNLEVNNFGVSEVEAMWSAFLFDCLVPCKDNMVLRMSSNQKERMPHEHEAKWISSDQ